AIFPECTASSSAAVSTKLPQGLPGCRRVYQAAAGNVDQPSARIARNTVMWTIHPLRARSRLCDDLGQCGKLVRVLKSRTDSDHRGPGRVELTRVACVHSARCHQAHVRERPAHRGEPT